MTTRDLLDALKDATRDEMMDIRRLLGIRAPEHPTVAEMTGDPKAGQGFGPKRPS